MDRRAQLTTILAGLLLSFSVQSGPDRPAEEAGGPSPASGSDAAKRAHDLADKALYRPVEYQNAGQRGPNLVVIPGEIKSSNVDFTQKFGPNNIADFAELELARANFGVLERSDMGPLLQEFQLAFTLGDPDAAGRVLQKGKLRTTQWVVKLDILKAEHVAAAREGFDGRALGQLISIFGSTRSDTARRNSDAAGNMLGSVKTDEGTGVWIIGMRYKILNAVTTEQVATGYTEEKMEIGAKATSVMGFSQGAQGGLTLDGMVQRMVQKLVWEIDARYKGTASAPPPVAARSAPAPSVPPVEHPRQAALPDPDSETWLTAQRANSAGAYRAYLEAFPAGRFAAAARIALAAMPSAPESPPPAIASPPAVAPAPTSSPRPAAVPEPRTIVAAAQPEQTPPAPSARTATRSAAPAADLPPCPADAAMSAWNDCRGQEKDEHGAITYAGAYRNGMRDGQGSYTWPSGEKYEGEFSEGKIEGKGSRRWPSGEIYVGEFRDGRIEGRGARTWPNGEKYVGQFKDGNSHGEGSFSWPNGEQYTGQFAHGRIDGEGTRSWPNGEKYRGAFSDGRIHGHGTYHWPNGEKYVGQWVNGSRHGEGVLYNSAGAVAYRGLWANDRRASE